MQPVSYPRPVTIRDLATATGLSIATISLAMRNHPRISCSTRERVQAAARELGYRVNPMMAAHWETIRARKTVSFQSVIAVISDWETVPHLQAYPWIMPVFSALQARADALGYRLEEFSIAAATPGLRTANLQRVLRMLKARGIYAFATIFSAHPSVYVDAREALHEFASVFICAEYKHIEHSMRGLCHIPFHRANPDHYGNMLQLVERLRDAGYVRPGFWPNSWAEARLAGETTAAFNFAIQVLPAKNQLTVRWPKWKVDPPLEASRRDFLSWLREKKPDVVIGQRFEVKAWIESLGLRIPQDIGLAHTDLGPPEVGWSGMDCLLPRVAAAGADLLTAHLHRNERGLPDIPKDVRIEGVWVQGATTHSASRHR